MAQSDGLARRSDDSAGRALARSRAYTPASRGNEPDDDDDFDERKPPARPSVADKPGAPVIVKLPLPFTVGLSQVAWILSMAVGAVVVVYMFVIREAQLPAIVDIVKAVDATRADETYTAAADIIFWVIFGMQVLLLFIQIMLQVSFSNRRPNVRWWQFGVLLTQAGVVLIARELLAVGDRGIPLERIMLIQLGLALLGLLIGLFPPALRWTARGHDVRRGPIGSGSSSSDL